MFVQISQLRAPGHLWHSKPRRLGEKGLMRTLKRLLFESEFFTKVGRSGRIVPLDGCSERFENNFEISRRRTLSPDSQSAKRLFFESVTSPLQSRDREAVELAVYSFYYCTWCALTARIEKNVVSRRPHAQEKDRRRYLTHAISLDVQNPRPLDPHPLSCSPWQSWVQKTEPACGVADSGELLQTSTCIRPLPSGQSCTMGVASPYRRESSGMLRRNRSFPASLMC